MNRVYLLAVVSVVLGGCAADFSEDRTEETTNPPAESSEQTTSDSTVKTYGGQLMRPAETVGTVDEAVTTVHSRAIHDLFERVDSIPMDRGPQFNRSMTQ